MEGVYTDRALHVRQKSFWHLVSIVAYWELPLGLP